MLIGVRSLQNGRKSFLRKKNFKYLQVSRGVSFVVTQLWNLNCVHRLFCFVLEFFLTCCLNLEYDSASTTSFLFCQIPLEQQHDVFPVLSVAPSPEAGVYYSRNKSVIWSLLSKSWLTIFFFLVLPFLYASCFTSCNFFLWFFSFLPSFILLFLSQFFITVTLFFSFLPSLPSFISSFSQSSFLVCSFHPFLLPSFLLYSQHFIFTLFISFIDFFLLCFFLFALSSVLPSFKIRFVRKLHYINNYNIISSWILFSKSGFNNGWCLVKCRIDR